MVSELHQLIQVGYLQEIACANETFQHLPSECARRLLVGNEKRKSLSGSESDVLLGDRSFQSASSKREGEWL